MAMNILLVYPLHLHYASRIPELQWAECQARQLTSLLPVEDVNLTKLKGNGSNLYKVTLSDVAGGFATVQ